MSDFLLQNEYVQFLSLLIGSILFSLIFNFILSVYIKNLTKKTESEIDDILLKIITKPIAIFIIFIGIYFSFKRLSILNSYSYQIDESFFVIIIIISSYLISKVVSFSINLWLQSQDKHKKTPKLLDKLIATCVYLIGLILVLAHFEVQITPLLATLGIGGLAVGLAIKNTLTNLFAGIHMLSDQPIKVDDYIEIPEEKINGYVQDIGWRSTRIRSLTDNTIIVPNSKLAENTIINNFLPKKKLLIIVKCGVDYKSDLDLVEKVTLEVANNIQKISSGAITDHKPSLKFRNFGKSNIEFTIVLGVEDIADKFMVRHEFIKALKKRYDQEGIEISYPVRKVIRK